MATNYFTDHVFMRLRYDSPGNPVFAPATIMPRACVEVHAKLLAWLAQGRIVSITRGNPPPERE